MFDLDFYDKKFKVLYVKYTVDAYDEPIDIFIGADNEDTLQKIAEEYCTLGYNIKRLDEEERHLYGGSKYMALYGRLKPFMVPETMPDMYDFIIK